MFSLTKALEAAGYNVSAIDSAIVETFRRSIAGVAQGALNEWVRLAQARLKTSRSDYLNGLRQAESFMITMVDGEPVYTIQLVGEMPNNFEFGMPSFDMKNARPGWLGGTKAKVSDDGHRYVVIPFRHSKSSSSRLGYSGKAKADGLQAHLRKATKDYGLDRMMKLSTGAPASGPVGRIPSGAPVHPYLKGLTKVQDVSPSGNVSSQLVTWRIMSENSPADSWIHPGLTAANLLAEVERWVDRQMKSIIDTTMKAAAR